MYMPRMRTDDFFKIKIQHLATGNMTAFQGWVTEFSDKFTSNWTPTNVYGRMDPLATFSGTSRIISLGFDVVSDNVGEAMANLNAVDALITFLYPVYEQQALTGNQRVGQTIKAAPLIGLEWTNLIADSADGGQLVGYLGGLTYAPDMKEGGFGSTAPLSLNDTYTTMSVLGTGLMAGTETIFTSPTDTEIHETQDLVEVTQQEQGLSTSRRYIPKKLTLSFDFTVLHKHLNGWVKSAEAGFIFGNENTRGFPHSPLNSQAPLTSVFSATDLETGATDDISAAEAALILAAGGSS
jgi:hypothetical protein